MNEQRPSFSEQLLAKLSMAKKIEAETGKPTTAAQKEVLRQITQVSKLKDGDPISGKGITKSGKED